MWPPDRSAVAEYLRVGRLAVERWQGTGGTLSLHSGYALPQGGTLQPQRLAEAVLALYPTGADTRRATRTRLPVTLLLESAWLPVMLVDTGPAWLRAAQLDALVRHRLGLYFSDGPDPMARWDLRIEHRAGSRYALAYGMAPRLKQVLTDTAANAGLNWAAMTPALAWGLDRVRPTKTWHGATGWFVWPEQDRTLVAQLASTDVIAFNAGAAPVADEAGVSALIDAESARLGLAAATLPIAVATWVAAPQASGASRQVAWFDVRESGGRPAAPTRSTSASRVPA